MFPTVAETLGELCSCGRELCWRQLGLKPRKLYILHALWSVRIRFEQTSYIGSRVQIVIRDMSARLAANSTKAIRSTFMILNTIYINPGFQHIYYKINTSLGPSKKSWRYFTRPTKVDLWITLRNFTHTMKNAIILKLTRRTQSNPTPFWGH